MVPWNSQLTSFAVYEFVVYLWIAIYKHICKLCYAQINLKGRRKHEVWKYATNVWQNPFQTHFHIYALINLLIHSLIKWELPLKVFLRTLFVFQFSVVLMLHTMKSKHLILVTYLLMPYCILDNTFFHF